MGKNNLFNYAFEGLIFGLKVVSLWLLFAFMQIVWFEVGWFSRILFTFIIVFISWRLLNDEVKHG